MTFWLEKYEVTQAQWETVMRNNPSVERIAQHARGFKLRGLLGFLTQLNVQGGQRKAWCVGCRRRRSRKRLGVGV